MQEASKYTELAMNHQWIALARLWLENNAPCSREKMFVELGMLMPDTIRRNGGSIAGKHTLVKQAYCSIFGTQNIPDEVPRPPTKKVWKGYTQIILDEARKKKVRTSDFPDIKNCKSLIWQMRKRGILKKNDDGSYEAV